MFVSSHPPSIAMTDKDIDALRNLIQTSSHLRPEVAEFLAHEIDRADRIDCAYSMLDYVTLGSWVLYRLDPPGEIRFSKLEFSPADTTITAQLQVATPIGAALIGLRQDQSIAWRTRDGKIERLAVLMILPPAHWLSLGST